MFVLSSCHNHEEKFLSFKHPNINFSLVKENDGRLSFLDINIFSKKGKLATWRKTLSDVYNNFNSFIPETYKTGLIKLLLFYASVCTWTL